MTHDALVKTPSSPARLSPALMMAAPISALAYPFLVMGFHVGITSSSLVYPALAAVALSLAILLPVAGLKVALRLGEHASPTPSEIRAKWIALLSAASAPMYTALGVLLYMAGDPIRDILVWVAGWTIAIALMGRSAFGVGEVRSERPAVVVAIAPRVRTAHGISAMLLVVMFLGMHLTNHLAGLWSESAHHSLMDLFRNVYRSRLIEPVVVTLFLFMVGSGLMLVAQHTRRQADVFRTLQLTSGIYLVFFVLGHMNSVFIYARTMLGIPTDWNFATGAPTGLIKDAWNVRLLPHYLLGVFFVLTHIVLGARVVALAHDAEQVNADAWTWLGICLSAVVAGAIILGMSGLHFLS